MHLWQGYHSSNAVLISLHPFRWHSVLKHSITDDVLINHLIKVMSASHFHCEVFGRGWSILRKFLPYQNVNLHFYLLYQYGLSASYITPIIMYHNPWLSFILMFTLSLIWPEESLQANFCVIVCQCKKQDLIPDLEKFHLLQLSPCTTTIEPVL